MLSVLIIKQTKQRGTRQLWEVLDMSITLIVVISQMLTYIQTHPISYIKYMESFVYHLNLNKAVSSLKRKRTRVKHIAFFIFYSFFLKFPFVYL